MGTELRIGFLSTLYHTSHILREGNWLEKELGVECRWCLFGTGPEMIQAFEGDEVDVGYMGLPPFLIGIARGMSLVCIGGGHVEGTLMVAGSSYSGLGGFDGVGQVLQQFRRCRVGTPARGSIHDVIFRDLLLRYSCQGVEIINYSWADLIPNALLKKDIEAAVGTPPLAVLCERECGTHVVIPPGALWPFNPSYGIVARRGILSETALLEDFLALHERACNLMRDAPESAAQVAVRALPWLDKGFVRKVYAISPRYCASLPDPYIRSTMEFVPALRRLGYLETSPAPEAIFDTRCINRVHPGPHHY